MATDDPKKWDARYSKDEAKPSPAARVLIDNQHLLPSHGSALEIACGMGGNSLFLAQHGLNVHASDLSKVAIEKLLGLAKKLDLPITGEALDITQTPPPSDQYDVIVISHYLDRRIAPAIIAALKPNGLLFYQTFTRRNAHNTGPSDQAFRLADNEFLSLFKDLRILSLREEGDIGDLSKGVRDVALLVAIKP